MKLTKKQLETLAQKLNEVQAKEQAEEPKTEEQPKTKTGIKIMGATERKEEMNLALQFSDELKQLVSTYQQRSDSLGLGTFGTCLINVTIEGKTSAGSLCALAGNSKLTPSILAGITDTHISGIKNLLDQVKGMLS